MFADARWAAGITATTTPIGYTVSVGDVPCDPSNDQPCPPDPNAHICRPLPGLTEWSLGAPEYREKLALIDQKTPRPQTPARPDESTWAILQLNYIILSVKTDRAT